MSKLQLQASFIQNPLALGSLFRIIELLVSSLFVCALLLLGGVFKLHTHVDVCRRSDVCSAAIEKKKKESRRNRIVYMLFVPRIPYCLR